MNTVLIPNELYRKLDEIARKRKTSIDELVCEILTSWIEDIEKHSEVELKEKASYYLELSSKYIKEGEDFLQRGNYVQASEKFWGAASEIVKAVAAKRNIEIRSHSELFQFVAELKAELNDPQLTRAFGLVSALHQNSYEDWLPPEVVVDYAKVVKQFITKLRDLVSK